LFRLYTDEDSMTRALISALRDRGVDLTTVDEQGMRGRQDAEQLAVAMQLGHALYSRNVGDFCELHSNHLTSGRHHTAIVVAHMDFGIGEQLHRLLRLLSARTEVEMLDALEFLSSWG
jgi:DNA-binding transcriptional MerR regulator